MGLYPLVIRFSSSVFIEIFYPFSFQCIDVSIIYEIYDELDSPSVEYPPIPPKPSIGSTSQSGSIGSYSSVTSDGKV